MPPLERGKMIVTDTNHPDAAIGEAPRLTREDADRLYRATGAIADPAALLADFVARSRAYRATHRAVLDLAYGPGEDQRLDIFLPAQGNAAAPVHIFIHGGYWYQFGKDEWSFVAEALTDAGAIVVVPRYALCPDVTIGGIVDQMRAMLRWVWDHIGRHGGDRERIFLSGHSAGGHLALELLLTDWRSRDLPADVIKGVTTISGLYDLRPIRTSYVQEHVRLSEDDAARWSPLLRIAPSPTPLIVAVAETDPEGFHAQAHLLVDRWRAEGGAPAFIAIDGHNHLTELYDLARADSALTRAILAQMGLGSA